MRRCHLSTVALCLFVVSSGSAVASMESYDLPWDDEPTLDCLSLEEEQETCEGDMLVSRWRRLLRIQRRQREEQRKREESWERAMEQAREREAQEEAERQQQEAQLSEERRADEERNAQYEQLGPLSGDEISELMEENLLWSLQQDLDAIIHSDGSVEHEDGTIERPDGTIYYPYIMPEPPSVEDVPPTPHIPYSEITSDVE